MGQSKSVQEKSESENASYKLSYFDFRGRGETSRLLFALKGQPYVDNRVQFEDWPELKPKTPTGHLPYLEYNNHRIAEAASIVRFLGGQFGYMGTTPVEAAQIDSLIQIGDELFPGITSMALKILFKDAEASEKMKSDFDTKSTEILTKLDNAFKSNDHDFFVGDQVSVADVHFFNNAQILLEHEEFHGILDPFPQLKTHLEKIGNIPNIKEYVRTRRQTPV